MQLPMAGRGLLPDVDTDTLHLWTCDETGSGDDLHDLMGNEDLPILNGAATKVDAPVGTARNYDGGDDHQGDDIGVDASDLQGDLTVSAFIRVDGDETFGAERSVFSYGASGETAATNYQVLMNINTDSTVDFFREQGAGVDSSGTSTWKIRRGQWTLVTFRVADEGGGTQQIDLFVNGTFVETIATGLTAPSGGSSGRWYVGSLNGTDRRFDGDVGYLFVSTRALTDDEIADQWRAAMMQTVETYVDAYVEIDSQDMSDFMGHDWFEGATIRGGVDDATRQVEVRLTKDIDRLSLTWLRENSRVNLTDASDFDSYSPLVMAGKDLNVYNARMPLWVTPTADDWSTVFVGEIDDVNAASSPMVCTCRDFGVELSLREAETAAVYSVGGTDDIEDVAAAILAAWSTLTLFVEENSNYQIREYEQQIGKLHQILRTLALLKAWDLKVKWDQGTSQHRLTLFNPGRDRVDADFILKPEDYYSLNNLKISRLRIRNKITGQFPEVANLDNQGVPIPKTEMVQDSASQLKYGLQSAGVTSSVASMIDTSAKHLTFLNGILSDLKDPEAELGYNMPYTFELGCYDYLSVYPNHEHDNVRRRFGSTSFIHDWNKDGNNQTTINLRGKTTAGNQRIHDILGGNGISEHPPTTAPVFPAASVFDIEQIAGGVRISHPSPVAAFKDRWDRTEIHVNKGSGDFTPSTSTQKGRGKSTSFIVNDLETGSTYRIKALVVDKFNNQAEVDLGTAEIRYFGNRHFNPYAMDARVAMIQNAGFNVVTLGPIINFPPDNWRMNAGTWNSDASLNSSVIQSGQYSLQLETNTADVRYVQVPVTSGLPYKFNWAARADSVGATSKSAVKVRWFDSGGFVLSTSTLRDSNEPAINTWTDHAAFATAPATAVTAELVIDRSTAAGSFNVYYDRVEMNESRPGFEARKTSGTTTLVNKVDTKCTFNSEEHDHGGVYDTSTNRYDARRAGPHTFTASVQVADTGTLVLILFKNGTEWIRGGVSRDEGAGMPLTATVAVAQALLDKGDYVEVFAYYSGTGNTTMATGTNTNHFSGREIE